MARINLPHVVIPNLSKVGIPARVTAINISKGSAEVTVTPSMEFGTQVVEKRGRRSRGKGRPIQEPKSTMSRQRVNYTDAEYQLLIRRVQALVHSLDNWPSSAGGKKRGIRYRSSDNQHRLVFEVV